MNVFALVAGPGFGVVDSKELSTASDVSLGNLRVGSVDGDFRVGARGNGRRHIVDEFLSAVRVNVMVAKVVRHHHLRKATAFGKTCRHGKHNPVAERHHGRLHVFVRVVPFGNRVRTRQQRRRKIVVHELQRNRDVRNPEPFAVEARKGDFLVVVVAAIVKRNRKRNVFGTLVEQRGAVHSSGEDQ